MAQEEKFGHRRPWSVRLLPGNDAPDPAARVRHIAVPPRDQVDVTVKEGLARSLADIDPDIETGDGRVLRNDAAPDLVEQSMHRIAFLAIDIEIAGDVPPRQDQRMQRCDRRSIAQRKRERICTYKPGFGDRTEYAARHFKRKADDVPEDIDCE